MILYYQVTATADGIPAFGTEPNLSIKYCETPAWLN